MNNKPHTEREEEWVCCNCELKEGDNIREISKDGWCSLCMRRLTLACVIRPPKGKTAVTFYIPDGMTFGEAITKTCDRLGAIGYKHHEYELDIGEFYEQINICGETDEKIQEAIDNTFPQNRMNDKIIKFIGKEVFYDPLGQFILCKDSGQILVDVRGWGRIQHLFPKTEDGAQKAGFFQDQLGKWIADAVNQKITYNHKEE